MFNQYPYLNLNDLNLDYILKAIREMRYEVTNFVAINAIKYADPIQWDITRQYEKNTVVIDPLTGVAYISVAPVPSGVALTRTEFWTVVFDLGAFITRAAQNFTSHYEQDTTLTATFPSSVGDWLIWGDVLYRVISPIVAGDQYVVNSNIEHFTIEDLYNAYLNTVANILALIGNLADLATSDTSDIVHAINSVLNDLNVTIGDINDLITSDTTDIVNAINSVLNDANTAINALDAHVASVFVTPQEFGAVADGITDDTQAFNDALAAGSVYVPAGTYYIDGIIAMDGNKSLRGVYGLANANTVLKFGASAKIQISGNYNSIRDIILDSDLNKIATGIEFISSNTRNHVIENVDIKHMDYAILSSASYLWCTSFRDVYINGCAHGISCPNNLLVCDFVQVYWSYDYELLDIAHGECLKFDSCNYGLIRGDSIKLANETNATFINCNFECDIVLETAGAIFTLSNWFTTFENCAFKLKATNLNYGFNTTSAIKALIFRECSITTMTGNTMPRSQFWGTINVGLKGALVFERCFNFPPLVDDTVRAGMHEIQDSGSMAFDVNESTITTINIPMKSYYCVSLSLSYTNTRPKTATITTSDSSNRASNAGNETGTGNNQGVTTTIAGYTDAGLTLTLKGAYYTADTNAYLIGGFYYTAETTFSP